MRWDPGSGPLSAVRGATKLSFDPVAAPLPADRGAGLLTQVEGAYGP
ncbi:hypothetical protein [Amycolatopsis vastitatis]|nr:hypothetical protein [Amycolatopsis vastitatis]